MSIKKLIFVAFMASLGLAACQEDITATFILNTSADCSDDVTRKSMAEAIAGALDVNVSSKAFDGIYVADDKNCSNVTIYKSADISGFSEAAIEEALKDLEVSGIENVRIYDEDASFNVSCADVANATMVFRMGYRNCENNAFRNAFMCAMAKSLDMVPEDWGTTCTHTGVFIFYGEQCFVQLIWGEYANLTGGEYPTWNSTLKETIEETIQTDISDLVLHC